MLQPIHLYVRSVGHTDMLGGVCCRWFLDDVLRVLGKLVARGFTIVTRKIHVDTCRVSTERQQVFV